MFIIIIILAGIAGFFLDRAFRLYRKNIGEKRWAVLYFDAEIRDLVRRVR